MRFRLIYTGLRRTLAISEACASGKRRRFGVVDGIAHVGRRETKFEILMLPDQRPLADANLVRYKKQRASL